MTPPNKPERKPKRAKAKFKLGQVVYFDCDFRYEIITKVIRDKHWAGGSKGYLYELLNDYKGVNPIYVESELRPLTKRERGE